MEGSGPVPDMGAFSDEREVSRESVKDQEILDSGSQRWGVSPGMGY